MLREISTPVEQGTLIARLVWDNEKKTDGISISIVRFDGQEDEIFTVFATVDGLSYDLSVLLADLDENRSIDVQIDEENAILKLESREDERHDDEDSK